jgi:hypothetical protein
VAKDIADRLNEQAYREERDRLVAMTPETRGLRGLTPVLAGLPPRWS